MSLDNWKYQGCWKEGNMYKYKHPDGTWNNFTFDKCAEAAQKHGALYMGLVSSNSDRRPYTSYCQLAYNDNFKKRGADSAGCVNSTLAPFNKLGKAYRAAVYKNIGMEPEGSKDGKNIYLGCHRDTDRRAIPNRVRGPDISLTKCADEARKSGSNIFGLQAWQGDRNKGTGECYHGKNPDYGKYNDKNIYHTCNKYDGDWYGGSWTNAVYQDLNDFCKNGARSPIRYLVNNTKARQICPDRKDPYVQAKCCFGEIKDPLRCMPNACDESHIKTFCAANKTHPKCACEYPPDLPENMIKLGLAPCFSGKCVKDGYKLQWAKDARAGCPSYVDCTQVLQTQAGRDIVEMNPKLKQACGNTYINGQPQPDPTKDATRVPITPIETEESIYNNNVKWVIIMTTVVIVLILLFGGTLLLVL